MNLSKFNVIMYKLRKVKTENKIKFLDSNNIKRKLLQKYFELEKMKTIDNGIIINNLL